MIYGYSGICITDFPVVLGYSNTMLRGRVAFIEDVAVVFFMVGISLYWRGWAAKKI